MDLLFDMMINSWSSPPWDLDTHQHMMHSSLDFHQRMMSLLLTWWSTHDHLLEIFTCINTWCTLHLTWWSTHDHPIFLNLTRINSWCILYFKNFFFNIINSWWSSSLEHHQHMMISSSSRTWLDDNQLMISSKVFNHMELNLFHQLIENVSSIMWLSLITTTYH